MRVEMCTESKAPLIFTKAAHKYSLSHKASSTVTYLGLILDPKLRWVLHFQYLKGILSR
jgi:hypothetical protein